MGGKAIKSVTLSRLDKQEYNEVKERVLRSLKEGIPGGIFREVPAYHSKPDFGDADILYSLTSPDESSAFFDAVLKSLGACKENTLRNGKVTSVAYPISESRYFQVDLIESNPCRLDFSLFYYGYNDVGYVLGRIARFLGMKLKDDGLYYPYTKEGSAQHVIKDLHITSDVSKALELLGYAPESYSEDDFGTMFDVYDFLTKTSYFCSDMFMSQHQNNKWRKRAKVRPGYHDFLSYITKKSMDQKYSYSDRDYLRSEKLYQLMRLDSFRLAYLDAERDEQINAAYKEHYNADKVRAITGADGNELGDLMRYMRDGMSKQEFKNFIMEMSSDDLERLIIKNYLELRG